MVILRYLHSLTQAIAFRPNDEDILHAWRKSQDSEAPERCEELIKEMFELGATSKSQNCKPDSFAITVCRNFFAQSLVWIINSRRSL